jgi:ABC-type polysaccharide/polyol phosphate export permease
MSSVRATVRPAAENAGARGAGNKSLLRDMRESLGGREFWAYAVWLDMVSRYRRMRLGVLWLLLPPLVYVLGLGGVYSQMMKKDMAWFIPHLGFGYILWRFAIQTITESADVFFVHKAFVMDGRVRLTDYVLRTLAKSSLYFSVGMLVLLVVVLVDPAVRIVWLPTLALTIPLFVANLIWMGTVIALLGARFRDTREIINTCLIFGFLLTPILWDASLVPPYTLRGILMRLNPFFHLLELVRAPVLGLRLEKSTLIAIPAMTVCGWLLAAVLYRRYARFVPLWI